MGSGELGLELYAGGGYNQFEQNRVVRINDFFGQASSDYAGTHLNGSARLGYDIALSDRFWIRPSVSLDYLRLSEDGYTETGTEGIALDVSSRVSERASASAMLNMGAKFQGRRTWIRPAVRVGYRQALLNDPVLTEFAFAGLSNAERATLNSMGFPDSGFLVGFSIAAGSEYSSIGFDVDSDIRDGFIRHTGRVVIRLLF
jgi:outer membrane autotransporter protein